MKKVWLSRQRDGSYMMTAFKPIKRRVGRMDFEDFYMLAGEPIGVRHLCPIGIKHFLGVEIEIGSQVRVSIEIKTSIVNERRSSNGHAANHRQT